MEDFITSSECAKELGVSRRTLMRWEEKGWLKAVTRDEQGNRLYRKHHVQWAMKWAKEWDDIRRKHRQHLRKLPAAQMPLNKLIRLQPLERTMDFDPIDLGELRKAVRGMKEWEVGSRKISLLYSDFFKRVQRLKRNFRYE